MATSLDFARHLQVIDAAARALAGWASSAGLRARVPTCPAWLVSDLVAHQGMVHRWAAANLRHDGTKVPSKTAILRTVPQQELLGWFSDGAASLLTTLREVDEHVEAVVFLRDAPAPRDFWARRQAHETTIHAMDALAATLGRAPTAEESMIDRAVALDGIDELVCGFVPRGSKLAGAGPFSLSINPTDAEAGWTLHVTREKTIAQAGTLPGADAVFSGTAVQLYLGLWNRGDEFTTSGRPGVREMWTGGIRIRWS